MIPIFKIVGSFFRGAIKAFPLGNAIIEGVNNAKGGAVKTVVGPNGESFTGTEKDPHSWVSIIVQVALIIAMAYGIYTKEIDINKVIDILRSI